MGTITDKEMGSRVNGADQWFTDPGPRGSGRFLGRITAAGERSFYFRYTTSTGQRDTMSIGPYDPKGRQGSFTLAAAREKAAHWAKLYREGARDLREYFAQVEAHRLKAEDTERQLTDREAHRTKEAEQQAELDRQRRVTIKQVFDRWASTDLAPHVGGDGKRIGRRDGGQYVREQFERRVFPHMGDVALVDVRKAHILTVLDAVKAEGKLRTTNVLLADLKQMFRFAAEREIIDHSPIELLRKRNMGGKDVKRSRVLSNEEITALVKQLPKANLSKRTEIGIWIILATGCRIGELMGAVWNDPKPDQSALQTWIAQQHPLRPSEAPKLGVIDLVARTWYLPTTKNQRDHTIHLSDFAVEQFSKLAELREVDPVTNRPMTWVFPDRQGTGPVCIKSFGKQIADRQRSIETRMKNRSSAVDALILPGGHWTAHDLRRTTSTMMSQLGISNDVINECENHIKQGMSAVYIQDRREAEQASAYDAVGKRLTTLISLGKKRPGRS